MLSVHLAKTFLSYIGKIIECGESLNRKKVLVIGYGIITRGILKILRQSNKYTIYLYSRHLNSTKNGSLLVSEDELSDVINQVDFVITCFSNHIEMDSFINDIILNVQSLHKTIVIDFTTSRIDCVERFKIAVEANEGYYIEAPFTGSKSGSNSGQLSIFIHFDKSLTYNKKELMELLKTISKKIYFFEKSTEPTKFKLIYNSWGAYLLYSIKLFNPLKYGFSPKSQEVAKTIVCNDGWMSLVCHSKLEQINNQNFDDIHFKIEYMVKDLEYANYSVFHGELREIIFLLQQYRDCLKNDSGKDYTVIGKNDKL